MAKHSEITYIRPKAKQPRSQVDYLSVLNTVLLVLITLKVFKVL